MNKYWRDGIAEKKVVNHLKKLNFKNVIGPYDVYAVSPSVKTFVREGKGKLGVKLWLI